MSGSPAQLIGLAWRSSTFEGGRVAILAPNYGGYGSGVLTDNGRPIQTPEMSGNGPPHNPPWNILAPVLWDQYVITADESNALQQAGLVQTSKITPVTFAVPGVASVADA